MPLSPATQRRDGDGQHQRQHDRGDDAGGVLHACTDDDGGRGYQQDDRDPGQGHDRLPADRVSRVVLQCNLEWDGRRSRRSRPVRSCRLRRRVMSHRCIHLPGTAEKRLVLVERVAQCLLLLV